MSACRSCGEPITWVELNGKPHPVNESSTKTIVLRDVTRDGKPLAKMVDGYTSHFATCPQAGDWRKR